MMYRGVKLHSQSPNSSICNIFGLLIISILISNHHVVSSFSTSEKHAFLFRSASSSSSSLVRIKMTNDGVQSDLKQIVVIGGGASGMFSAANVARELQQKQAKVRVVVLEGTKHTLSKVKISVSLII